MGNEVEASYAALKYVVRRLYDGQKLRIQQGNRLARMERDGIMLPAAHEDRMKKAMAHEEGAEVEYEAVIARMLDEFQVWREWLSRVKGVGPRLGGLLIANLSPITRFETAGKVWAYSGLSVIGGAAQRRTKGEKSNWNDELKATAFKLADSFSKSRSKYADMIASYKNYLVQRETGKGNVIWEGASGAYTVAFKPDGMAEDPAPPKERPDWSLGRIHNMARRRAVKIFLSNLWEVWREMEGCDHRSPYAIEKLGHEHVVNPWDMVEKKARRKPRAA